MMLEKEELRILLTRIGDHLNERNVIIIKLLLLTAVRINELLRAEWKYVDFDKAEWMIPDHHAKMGKGFVIPLPYSAVELFRRLQVLSCGSSYVLPSQSRSKNMTMDPNAVLMALARLRPHIPEVRRFSPHDLRSTAKSQMKKLGVTEFVAERCLNHAIGGVSGIYDQYDYFDERRKALSLWADYISHCESGREWMPDNVVPIKAAL
jgi:integrase